MLKIKYLVLITKLLLLLFLLLGTTYQTLVLLSKKQIMMNKYQTLKEYFTNYDYNKFTNDILDAKITEKKSVN